MEITGNIVDIFQRNIYPGTIIIKNNIIENILIKKDIHTNKYILPGFVDAHVHIESSMLTPVQFSRMAVKQGTVGVVTDPHEITNVLGLEGFQFMKDEAEKALLKVKFGVPSCVPATPFETTGAMISARDIDKLFRNDKSLHLSEMMNYPGVVNEDPVVMAKLEVAIKHNRIIDGHAPGLQGEELKKYVKAGILTDHECTGLEEAREKIKLGMYILIREGSAAKNLDVLAPLINEYPDRVMFCTDDSHPDDIDIKHINNMVVRSLKMGLNFWNVMQAAVANAVRFYNLNIGLLQKGDPADFIICEDLEKCKIKEVFIDGKKVFSSGQKVPDMIRGVVKNNFNCMPIEPEHISVISNREKKIRVIGVEEGSLLTHSLIEIPLKKGKYVVSDIRRDILKIVVVNRFSPQKPVIGFVHGFGLKEGAIASSIAHDSHNLICVGTEDELIVKAVNAVIAEKGGIAMVTRDKTEILSLPVAGLMTHEDGRVVAEKYKRINELVSSAGATLKAPFMTLSFMSLLVIPELKIGDKGLFDVNKFSLTQLFVE